MIRIACAAAVGGLAVVAATLLRAQGPSGVSRAPEPVGAGLYPEAYYSAAQAARGAAAYKPHCETCHPGGKIFGQDHVRLTFEGQAAYPSVYYLYTKMKDQPAPDSRTITTRMRVDIVAYLLQLSGFPAGPSELVADEEAMKLMPLDEPGFVRLFNGKDLSGFTFVAGDMIGPGPHGRIYPCAKPQGCITQPAPNWIVRNGILVCVCKEHGYFYTTQKFRNFTLRVDYRFPRPERWEGPDYLFGGNAGYYAFLDPNVDAGKAIAVEGRNRDVLMHYFIGGPAAKTTVDREARHRALRPIGEWNAVEIVSKNGDLDSYLNGALITHTTGHDFKDPGFIGFQNQGAELHWRNIRIRPQ